MSRFTSHLGLRLLEYANGRPVMRGDRCLWFLPEPLPFERGAEGSGQQLTVPAFHREAWSDVGLRAIAAREIRARGVTDLTSIPRLVRGLLPPDGAYVKAAVLHDDGYVSQGENYRHLLGRPATRLEVDADLYDAMEALGVGGLTRSVVYGAVRMGGFGAWGS